jgi:hypothetical protein
MQTFKDLCIFYSVSFFVRKCGFRVVVSQHKDSYQIAREYGMAQIFENGCKKLQLHSCIN